MMTSAPSPGLLRWLPAQRRSASPRARHAAPRYPLGSAQADRGLLRRVQWQAGITGQDGLPKRRPASRPLRQGHTPHPAPYRCNLADAARRDDLASGGVPWNVARGSTTNPRSPSSRLFARCGSGDRPKNGTPLVLTWEPAPIRTKSLTITGRSGRI